MVRSTDQEAIAIKKIICYTSQEEGSCYAMQGHVRKHQGWSGGRKSKEKIWNFIVVSVERSRKGRVSKVGWFE